MKVREMQRAKEMRQRDIRRAGIGRKRMRRCEDTFCVAQPLQAEGTFAGTMCTIFEEERPKGGDTRT